VEREGKRSRAVHDYSQMNQGEELIHRAMPKSDGKPQRPPRVAGQGPMTAPVGSRQQPRRGGGDPRLRVATDFADGDQVSPEKFGQEPEVTRVGLTGMAVGLSPSPMAPGAGHSWDRGNAERKVFHPLGDEAKAEAKASSIFQDPSEFDAQLANDPAASADFEGFMRHYLQPSPGGTRAPISPALVLQSPSPAPGPRGHWRSSPGPVEPFRVPSDASQPSQGQLRSKVLPPAFNKTPEKLAQAAAAAEAAQQAAKSEAAAGEAPKEALPDQNGDDNTGGEAQDEVVLLHTTTTTAPEVTEGASKAEDSEDAEVASNTVTPTAEALTRTRAASAAGSMDPEGNTARSALVSTDTMGDAEVDKDDSSSSEDRKTTPPNNVPVAMVVDEAAAQGETPSLA